MFDLFTYFIYLSLLVLIIFLTNKAYLRKLGMYNETESSADTKLASYHYVALFAISFIVGFRNNVGVDWLGYKNLFEGIAANKPTYEVELGYYFINKLVAALGGSSEIMFFLVALISWFFIFKSVSNLYLPLLLFFLFVEEYFFWSMNGVRQFVSISLFLYSIQFVLDRSLFKYLLFISIAILFHSSALLLLPLYFIPFQKLYNQKLWFIIFIISLFFSNSPFFVNGMKQIIVQGASKNIILTPYLEFFERGQYEAQDLVVGLGYYFKLLINLFIILFSKEVVARNPQSKIYFVLFFTSTIIFNLFYMYQPIGRLNGYFAIMRCIVLSLIIYHLWYVRRYRFLAVTVILLYLVLFLTTIYNSSNLCSPYSFSF